jgi:nicotinamidase-related amidase
MKNLLCVVDLQFPFVQADDALFVREAVLAVHSAKSRGDHIFMIEDRCGNPTVEAIEEALHDYPNVSRMRKNQWDGSLQVAMELDLIGAQPERITACGAFAEQCVLATLIGLRDRFPTIELEILRKACVPAPGHCFRDCDWCECSRRIGLILS